MRYLKLLLIAIPTLALGVGCAYMGDNAAGKQILQTDRLAGIQSIALLDVPEPSGIWMGSPGSGSTAGLFGPLTALATASHKGSKYLPNFDFAHTTREDLKNWLEQFGKRVVLVDAERTNKSKMLSDYTQLGDVGADAILEVGAAAVGYRVELGKMATSSADVAPFATLVYRLVSARDGEVLIQSTVHYSSFYEDKTMGKNVTPLRGPRQFVYGDLDSARRDSREATARLNFALRGATEYIAAEVANRLHTAQYSNNARAVWELNSAGSALEQMRNAGDQGQSSDTAPQSAVAEQRVSITRMMALISGNTSAGVSESGNDFHVFNRADGVMFGMLNRGLSRDYGNWEIDTQGRYCRQWKKWRNGDLDCYVMYELPNDQYRMKALDKHYDSTFRIFDGDPRNLATN